MWAKAIRFGLFILGIFLGVAMVGQKRGITQAANEDIIVSCTASSAYEAAPPPLSDYVCNYELTGNFSPTPNLVVTTDGPYCVYEVDCEIHETNDPKSHSYCGGPVCDPLPACDKTSKRVTDKYPWSAGPGYPTVADCENFQLTFTSTDQDGNEIIDTYKVDEGYICNKKMGNLTNEVLKNAATCAKLKSTPTPSSTPTPMPTESMDPEPEPTESMDPEPSAS